MRYNIKARCAMLGITMISLLVEMREQGHTLSPTEWSQAVNGHLTTKRAEKALECADKLLKEKESNNGKTKNRKP